MDGRDLIARNDDLLTTQVDGELLAMSIEQGACYGLNPVGTEIWNLLETPHTVDTLCEALLDRFEVTEETCRAEVADFLTRMQDEKMITITPAG